MTTGGGDGTGGLGRLFRRRRPPPPPTGASAPAPAVEAEPEDPDAQQRREDEAAAIQLAREQAISAESERLVEERAVSDRDAHETELAKLVCWTDTHCHLQYAPDAAEETALVARALEAGVRRMVCVGTDIQSSRRAIDVACRQSRTGVIDVEVYATVGLHPHDAASGTTDVAALLAGLDRSTPVGSRVVAVGECGLDYHYDHSPRSTQRKVFAAQVALANEHDLALVIHTREAFDDTLAILDSEGVPARTIFHCFTGGPVDAEQCLATGAYLSFSGIVTFNNAGDVRESARLCPVDRLLIETDSPYLTPVPHRGRPNEPSYVTRVGEAVAREREISPTEIATITSDNAAAAFGLARS